MGFIMKTGIILCFAFIILGVFAAPAMAEPEPRLSQFSGKPVPRFESLRYATVNGRTGPSLEYPIAWQYERAGLPVLILKESTEWRRVRDPEGAEVWVHARMLSAHTTGIARQDMTLKRAADAASEDVAIVQAGVIVDILETQDARIKVRKDRVLGWVDRSNIWGDIGPANP